MHAVDVLVEPLGVQRPVTPIEDKVLDHKEEGELGSHRLPGWGGKEGGEREREREREREGGRVLLRDERGGGSMCIARSR